MDRIFVKPATPEIKVRKPVNGYLAAEGEELNAESYWLRREADGDVVITPPKTQANANAAKPAKKAV
jgi:hypothetical protein